jgi:predicted esterase YcpF (UPF0227 family)
MKIVYFHGFGSTGNSEKSQALRARFGDENVWSPDLPLDAFEVTAMVADYMRSVEGHPVIFTGTSLGAFYANYFAHRFNYPCILVNPAVDPGQALSKSLGEHKNYATGLPFELTQNHLDKWSAMKVYTEISDINSDLINLFIALDDEVIDADKMLAAFPNYNYLKTFENAGHRFSDHWHEVVDFLDAVQKSPDVIRAYGLLRLAS